MSERIDFAGRCDASEVWPRRRLYPLASVLTEVLSPLTVVAVVLGSRLGGLVGVLFLVLV